MPGFKKKIEDPVPEGPIFPAELGYLWAWFRGASMGMPINGMSPPRISWETLRAWQKSMRIERLEPWEAECIIHLGAIRASVQSEHMDRERKKPPPK